MNNKQIRIGSIISYFTIFLNIILGLIYTPWILHKVGSSNYGLYTLASSVIALFLLDFGMSAAVSRFVSNFRAQNNFTGINAFAGLAIKFYIAICSILSVILAIVFLNIDVIYSNLTAVELQTFRIVFAVTAFFVVICFPVNIANGILNAFEQYIFLKGADVLNKIGTVIVTIVVLLMGGGIYAIVFVNGLFNFLTFILKCIIIKYKTPVHVSFHSKGEISLRQIFSFTAWSTISTISQQMIFNLMPTVLAMVTNTFAITLYGFANVIEGYVYNITQAINGLFMPSVSRIVVKENDARNVLPLMIKVGRLNQSVISILLIGLIVLGKEFVALWVGNEFNDLYYCIILLSFPYFISASQQIATTSIVVMNKVKYLAIINLITGIINLGTSYILAKKCGVVGVCLVTCLVFILRIIAMNYIYRYILNIEISAFFRDCHLKLMPGIVISLFVAYFTVKLIPITTLGLTGWLVFCTKVLLVSLIYFITMWFIGWNQYEKSLLISMISVWKRGK